jgi:hypothetical protein
MRPPVADVLTYHDPVIPEVGRLIPEALKTIEPEVWLLIAAAFPIAIAFEPWLLDPAFVPIATAFEL